MDDQGSVLISRDTPDTVTVKVRSPGSMTFNMVTLPFDAWKRIAIPPQYAVGRAGDYNEGI
jgi:hypothetical protein